MHEWTDSNSQSFRHGFGDRLPHQWMHSHFAEGVGFEPTQLLHPTGLANRPLMTTWVPFRLLSPKDSNLDYVDQNHMYYHYTKGQNLG